MRFMRQVRSSFTQLLEDYEKETGFLAGALSVTTLFAFLITVVQNWYDSVPVYKEFICGLTTWSGYNKQADMQVIKAILLGLPVLFLFFFIIVSIWKHFMPYKAKSGIIIVGCYFGIMCLFFVGHPMKWQYLCLWAVITVGYLICNVKTETGRDGKVFSQAVLAMLYIQLVTNALLLIGASIKPGISDIWQAYAKYYMPVLYIIFLIICIMGRMGLQIHRLYYLQVILPFAFAGLVHFHYLYELDGSTMELFYSGKWKWFCYLICIGLFLLCIFELRKKKQDIFLSTFIVTAVLRIFMIPQGMLNIDYFHNGELSLPMQQWISFGKLPYRDLIPIHGLCDYYYGLINYLFFDGTYMALNAAKIVGNIGMAVLLAIVIYYFNAIKMQGFFLIFLFMPFFINTAGLRYLFLFTMFFVLFSPVMRNGLGYLYSWTLLSIIAIAWNASIGGAGALAFLPVVLYRSIKFIPAEFVSIFTLPENKKKKNRSIIAWSVLVIIGIAFIPLFLQIVTYLRDNTGTTLYVNGMEMLKDAGNAASYLVPGLVNEHNIFFLNTFGFMIPILVCLYFSFRKGLNYARGYLVVLMLCVYVIMNYAFVRFDDGLRSGVIAVFFLIMITVTLLSENMLSETKDHVALYMYLILLVLSICLMKDSPVLDENTLCLRQNIPVSIDTEVGGIKVIDQVVYVSGDSVALPKMGTGFIQANMLNSIQKRQKVIEDCNREEKTIFDITNAVANGVIFDQPSYLPYTSAYNISNHIMQEKAIAILDKALPDVILAAPEVRFDDAPFSFRSMRLYRYLLSQDYVPYKYENVIYLVRGENPVKEAERNDEAFAQLMHKGYLGKLPAVWGNKQNLENFKKNEKLTEVNIDYKIKKTQEGIVINFPEPIDGTKIAMIGINFANVKNQTVTNETVGAEGQNSPSQDSETNNTGKEKKSTEIQLKWNSGIASEGSAAYTFLADGSDYMLPMCCSPYFLIENKVDHIELNYDQKDLSMDPKDISFQFYVMD